MASFLPAEACREKAIDCLIHADCLDDPKKAAMLRYAEWWNWIADYRDGLAHDGSLDRIGNTQRAKNDN